MRMIYIFCSIVIAVSVFVLSLVYTTTVFRDEYEKAVERKILAMKPSPALPMPSSVPAIVRRYVETAGRGTTVHSFRVVFHGRIRSGPEAPWLSFSGEQVSFLNSPARYFWMRGFQMGVPFEAYHVYEDGKATMRVTAAKWFKVIEAGGEKMDQSETVTVFNDMCLFAPTALLSAGIEWREVEPSLVKAVYSNAGHKVSADLYFNDAGELVNFVSLDRYQSTDGKTFSLKKWSTPLKNYRDFGDQRLASRGEARWGDGEESFSYIELSIDEVQTNFAGFDGD
jgi:hypothetical protein